MSSVFWRSCGWMLTLVVLVCSQLRAESGSFEQRIRACAAERDPAVRLACFDGVVAKANVPAPQPAVEEHFGVRGGKLAQQETAEDSGPRSVESTIAEIRRNEDGTLLYTLENGQVWAEKQSSSVRPQVGAMVTVKRGALNSYRMVGASGRGMRVTRVQ